MSTPSSAGVDCRLDEGEVATRTPKGWELPDGRVVASLRDCYFAVGAGWRIETPPYHHKRPRRHRMDPVPVPPTSDEVVAQVQDDAVLVTPPPKHVEAQEIQPTASDLSKLAQTDEQNPIIVLGLALLAVVGGGSAWKLWTKRSEQSHELAMKRLELDAATMNGTAQPPPCQAKQAEVEAKLAAMEARLVKVEKASLALPADFDADELTGRLGKVEAAIRRMGVKPPATKGGAK